MTHPNDDENIINNHKICVTTVHKDNNSNFCFNAKDGTNSAAFAGNTVNQVSFEPNLDNPCIYNATLKGGNYHNHDVTLNACDASLKASTEFNGHNSYSNQAKFFDPESNEDISINLQINDKIPNDDLSITIKQGEQTHYQMHLEGGLFDEALSGLSHLHSMIF